MAPRPPSTATLPVIPLPQGTVLFPGAVRRIAVSSNRPDIAALLAAVYARAASKALNGGIDVIPIACIPLASPYLGPDGQLLIEDGPNDNARNETGPTKATEADLYEWGVAARISGVEGRGAAEFALLVAGVTRVRVDKIYNDKAFLEAKVTQHADSISMLDVALDGQFQHLKLLAREYIAVTSLMALLPGLSVGFSPLYARRLDQWIANKKVTEAGLVADAVMGMIDARLEDQLHVLALIDVKERVTKALALLEVKVGSIKNNIKIMSVTSSPDPDDARKEMKKSWRQAGQLVPARARRSSVNGRVPPGFPAWGRGGSGGEEDGDEELNDTDELQIKLEAASLPPEPAKVAERDLKRLKKMMPVQAEYAIIRTYLETLAEIPWTTTTDDHLGPDTLTRARKQLDHDHYGLEKVKKRLLEYLAVLRLKQDHNENINRQIKQAGQDVVSTQASNGHDIQAISSDAAYSSQRLEALKGKRMVDKSPILLLVGPPGVGKTSLARSVATALGRKFHRISLGGVRDEAEIRGHRRTYVAAMPGLIIQGLRKVGVANPVFLLDEIDKIGSSNFHGDPSAAMLEVLDPEQNNSFTDHYLQIPIDLSKTLFIATANNLDLIPPPLLDRMETIYIPGYTTLEKRAIAMQHLLPKQKQVNALSEDQVVLTHDVVSKVIESYTREAGVRNLERELGSICRAKAVEFADAKDAGHVEKYSPRVTADDLERILGAEKFEEEIAEKTSRPGIVTGLVAYSSGGNGSILFIEVADFPGSGSVQLTGKLGDVLKESVEVALTWVKAHAYELGLTENPADNIMKNRSIHVHCPSGSVPKDGPSSGIGQAIAMVSLFSGRAVPPTMAMTGEISLRGRVTAVGGIKEKLIGALRAGVKTVLLPAQNLKDVKDLPGEVKSSLDILYVGHIWEAMRAVWPNAHWPGEQTYTRVESHL